MANELQLQFEKLSNQARFVKMIIEKELVVSNRKKADLMADLRKLKFRPFPKVTKAKAAGETEDVVNADEDEGAGEDVPGSTDYDYLLGMPIWSLTKEKVCLVGRAKVHGGLIWVTTRLRNSCNKLRTRRRNSSRCSSVLLSRSGTTI
jgi:hypothetical protein